MLSGLGHPTYPPLCQPSWVPGLGWTLPPKLLNGGEGPIHPYLCKGKVAVWCWTFHMTHLEFITLKRWGERPRQDLFLLQILLERKTCWTPTYLVPGPERGAGREMWKDRHPDLEVLWGCLPSWVQPQPQPPAHMRKPSRTKGQRGLQWGGCTRLLRWVLPAGSELTDSPGPGGGRNLAAVAPLRTLTLVSLPPIHERQTLAIADWERKVTVWFGRTILCSPPLMVLPPSDLCF